MTPDRRAARSRSLHGSAPRIAAVFLLVAATGLSAAPPVARQTYSITEFDTIRVEAPVDVVVATDRGVAASGTGDRETLDRIELQMNSRTLVVRMRNTATLGGSNGGRGRLPTTLTLSTGLVQRAILMGSGTLSIDRLKGAHVEARVNGSGRLSAPRVEADQAEISLLGSGVMTLAGSVPDVVVTISGSGRLDAGALNAQRLRVNAEGAADGQFSARDTAIASANGTGQIVITGKPVCTVRKTGSASVTCKGEIF